MIVADTHAWLWWLGDDPRLSSRAQDAMERELVGVASISLWEVALLSHRGRIALNLPVDVWLERATSHPRTVVLELTTGIAVTGAGFGDRLHRDPADRIIVATALRHGLRLVTADHAITASGIVETIW